MQSDSPAKTSVGNWLVEELLSFSLLAGYLFICFAALLYLKEAILEAQGVTFCALGLCGDQGGDRRQIHDDVAPPRSPSSQ